MEKNCKTCGGTSQGYTTCTGIIGANGICSVCGQEAISTFYQCGRLIPINAASDISPDLCAQGEKREMFEKVDIFTEEFLTEIGFILVEKNKSEFKPYPIYGKAKDRTGMTIICWCDEGHSCTYFGEKLQPNTSFSVEKDGGTRYAFNGYAYTQDDVRKILSLTW